jgi:transposase
MARQHDEARFVCEVELHTTAHDRRVLRSRLEAGRQLFNAVLGDLLRRLDAARRDPAWTAATAMPQGPPRSRVLSALRSSYGLSEYLAHRHSSLARECWIREHLDANTAQKVATMAWRAVEAHMFGRHGRPRFRRAGELRSLEGKKHDVGIRLGGWGGKRPEIVWDGAHAKLRLALALDEHDPLHLAARLAPVRYVRLVRREVRGRERYFCQLVCVGHPPVKRAARPDGRFGIDVGPSWIAVSDESGNAERHKLAPSADRDVQACRRYQRKLARQRRANNPDCYDERGQAIGGRRPHRRSSRQRRTEAELREAERKLRATRRNEQGQLANRLLGDRGRLIYAERISYRALQRAYGRSVRDRAPGRFMAELARKAGEQGGALLEIPTFSTFLSQRCLCGRRARKSLSERCHRCTCQHFPGGTYADRDELAAFLALFCDENGTFDQHAAVAAWEGGANDRLLRTEQVRESVAKPRDPRVSEGTRQPGRSGSTDKRQRTPVTSRRTRVRAKPRGQRRTHRATAGPRPPSASRGNH